VSIMFFMSLIQKSRFMTVGPCTSPHVSVYLAHRFSAVLTVFCLNNNTKYIAKRNLVSV
jgi:hypothetical protein